MDRKLFLFLFMVLWIVPPITNFFSWGDSYTVSTIACACLLLFSNISSAKNINIKYSSAKTLLSIFFIILTNITITFLYFGLKYNISKGVFSLLLMIIFLTSAYYFSQNIEKIEKKKIDIFFRRLLYFHILIAIISPVTGLLFPFYGKPIFPYSEPSHYSLFFAPVWAYNVLSAQTSKYRGWLIFIGFTLALFIENMTFLATAIILSVFIFHIYAIPLIVICGITMLYCVDFSYFMDRLSFGDDSMNLSALVYKKGFETIEESFNISNGLGIGFQQLGYINIETPSRDLIMFITDGLDLNEKDGGFHAAKIISEFGVIGIFFILWYLWLLINRWLKFRKMDIVQMTASQKIYYASIITIFSELFFRGLGYFTPTMFLFASSFFLIKNENTIKTLSDKIYNSSLKIRQG